MLQAMEDGYTNEQIFEFTNIDPWFLSQFRGLHEIEEWLKTCKLSDLTFEDFFEVKRKGFSDAQLARFLGELHRIIARTALVLAPLSADKLLSFRPTQAEVNPLSAGDLCSAVHNVH